MSKKNEIVDKTTGEIVVVRGTAQKMMKPPKAKEVTPIEQVAGKNPPAFNLRDHPELAGMEITIMDCSFRESTLGGKKNSYVILASYVTAPGKDAVEEDFRLIITGSENIVARVADACMVADPGTPFPLKGTLRCSSGGRAWFLD